MAYVDWRGVHGINLIAQLRFKKNKQGKERHRRNGVVAARTDAVKSYKWKLITTVGEVYMNLFSEFLLSVNI